MVPKVLITRVVEGEAIRQDCGAQSSFLSCDLHHDLAVVLNSPWDVCFEPSSELLYIAMAGQHQIWVHDTRDGVTKSFSGDGFERNLNGPSPLSTSFSQPSGLTLSRDLQEIYIADSESSSIRALELRTGGSKLLAGGDPFFPENLFKFGDQDGIGSEALLQHPLGISCGQDGLIYIADSYNHKIKRLDPFKRQVVTLVGTGNAGFKDGPGRSAQLSEPSGIVQVGTGKFLVADTNNSLIRCLDLNGKEPILQTLELKGVQPPSSKPTSLKRLRRRSSVDTRTIAVQSISSKEGNLKLKISVPQGYHFSKEARSKFEVDVEPEDALVIEPLEGFLSQEGYASLSFKRALVSGAKARVICKVYFCKEDEVCLYQSVTFEVPFESVTEGPNAEASLSTTVKPRSSSGSLQPAFAS
ncbi:NHL repeat-containing protein 2 [Nymphaea thermarum]|nr:NHL repeat-containing protein 2 [Nymphaea thermarum]